MKSDGAIMEMLIAYDLTGSLRAAADLSSAHTTPSPATSLRANTLQVVR